MARELPDLSTRAKCLRYVRKILRDQAKVEKEHEAWQYLPEVEGNEVALWQAYRAITSLRAHNAEALHEVTLRLAALEVEASQRERA